MHLRYTRRFLLRVAALLVAALPLTAPAAHAQAKDIYPDPSVAKQQLHQALAKAKTEHKNVIVDFGGNWCGDCHALDIYFHDPANEPLLKANYELVDVNVGRLDQNQELAEQYGIPLKRGVPALVVLEPSGRVLYAQRNGEFEKMAKLQSSDLTKFLEDWKPARQSGRNGR